MKVTFSLIFAVLAIVGCRERPRQTAPSPPTHGGHGGEWVDEVPDMLQPVTPAPQIMPKALSERTEEFDSIILATKIHTSVHEVRGKYFLGIVAVQVEEVLKGDNINPTQVLEVVQFKSLDRSSVELGLHGILEPRIKRGILGLRALPRDAPFDYSWLWFCIPGGDNWEPALQAFREDVSKKISAQQPARTRLR